MRSNLLGNWVQSWPWETPKKQNPGLWPGLGRIRWLRGQDLNLRPSGYEPDELPGCSTPRPLFFSRGILFRDFETVWRGLFLSRFGGDLLSHVLRRSTIGATALNGRVRDGTGCFARAMTTKPRKKQGRGVR